MISRVLIVAGSDSGGGAGIQADIRTVTMLGGHPATAITALTAQNTLGVRAVMPVPADMVLAQIDAVLDDIGADAVKIGMIGSAAVAHAVADRLDALPGVPLVFDPVMVATSGALLADAETIAAFARLMARATLVTPNVPELATLTGMVIADADALEAAAAALMARHGCAVLAKGGHLIEADAPDRVIDRLIAQTKRVRWERARLPTRHTHGTGCTLASGIAAGLAGGLALEAAIDRAGAFVAVALANAPGLGAGAGPMGHALGIVPFHHLLAARDPAGGDAAAVDARWAPHGAPAKRGGALH